MHAVSDRLEGGFTLIELMTALAILVVLVLLAAPAFRELMANQRVQIAATDLFTSLVRARSEAIKKNTDVIVSPVVGQPWTGGWVVSASGNNIDNPMAPLPANDIDSHGATSNLSISGGPATVTYRSTGRISGTTSPKFSFSAVDTSAKRCVQVTLSGEPILTQATCS